MFKKLINSIKARIMFKLLGELCHGRSCVNCPANLDDCGDVIKPGCAQICILDQVLEKWCTNGENLKEGYCPICDKTVTVRSADSMCNCPTCGHHVCLHEPDKE